MSLATGCRALVAAAVIMAPGPVTVAEPLRLRPGMGGVADPGAIDCAFFNTIYEAGPTGFRQTVLYWTEGYVLGKSGLTMDAALAQAKGGPWTFDTLTDHVVDFCRKNPGSGMPAAVEDLWRTLGIAP